MLQRESAIGADQAERLAELAQTRERTEAELKDLEARWQEELKLVAEVRDLRERLETQNADAPAGERERLRGQLTEVSNRLRKLQGEAPLVQVCVDAQTIAGVVSAWTGIPVGRMVSDEIDTVLHLRQRLEERIIGQAHALQAIAQCIQTSRAGLSDPRKPIGVFLLVGPSGVGKTETALALAELLYGGDQNMTVLNMSEFKEEHKVALLMGSPPGYVGYGEGGVLTEAVRRRPYSVVLLDEMEKAHPGVQHVFYQVFDKGTLRDGEGRDIDFKNTILLMTSNAASQTILKLCADPETRPDPPQLAEALRPDLLQVFQAPFLGRVNLVPFFSLTDDAMRIIIELQLGRIRRRVEDNFRAKFSYSQDLVDHIAARCKEVDTGARNIDHLLTRSLLPELSTEFLGWMAAGKPLTLVHVSVKKDGNFTYDIS
jgi:type VI secretion system protein VasG